MTSLKTIRLADIEAAEAKFICKDFIPLPVGAVAILNSPGGIGKSFLALQIADKYAVVGGKTIIWSVEDKPSIIRNRFELLIDEHLTVPESMTLIEIVKENAIQFAKIEHGIFKLNTDLLAAMINKLCDKHAGLLVIDPMLSFYGGNENDNSQADIFMLGLSMLAQKLDISILLIHHSKKDGSDVRGATAFHNKCRARYQISIIKNGESVDKDAWDKGLRRIRIEKDSWGLRKYFFHQSEGEDWMNIQVVPVSKWI